jgi:RHS repeat-associated protein
MDEGNILSLKRRGILEECPDPHPQGLPAFVFDQIDNLGYTYSNNRLQAVNENASELKGYKGTGGTYQYDGGATDGPGNITYDGNKDISIEYNYLNLPEKITFNSQGSIIEWTYDATGRKIKKVVSGSSGSYTQLYLEGVEYKDNQLISIQHEEGRAVPNAEGTGFRQEFVLRDHLGNARVYFSDLNGDGALQPFACNPAVPCVPLGNGGGYTEALQVQHYYPFGMEFDGPWEMPLDPDEINHYTYNGKELNRDFGLEWLDYGARWYMPEIGRWNAVDPVTELAVDITPYRYGFNNPILYIDPFGLFETKREARKYRKEKRREARRNGESYRARIIKNSDGRYDVRNKDSDGYVTQKENGELEVGGVASESGGTSIDSGPSKFAIVVATADAISANGSDHISRYVRSRGYSGLNSNIYGNSLSPGQTLGLRLNTPLGQVKGSNVIKLATSLDYVGKASAAFGYYNIAKYAYEGQVSPIRAAVDASVVTYGWRGGLHGAAFSIGYGIFGPLLVNTEFYQNIKHHYILRTSGGRDGLLSTDY